MKKYYDVIIFYSGASSSRANYQLANLIKDGVLKSGVTVNDPINVYNFKSKNDKNALHLLDLIINSKAIILGTGDYNGNIEPPLLNFVDNYLKAGKSGLIDLSGIVAGMFVTSGDNNTGGQPILNSLARLVMTFGANIVSGGSWHISQGVVGVMNKNNEWISPYLKENANNYGFRVGKIASFFNDNYIKVMHNSIVENFENIKNNNINSKCINKKFINISIIIVIILNLIILFFYKIR